RVRLEGAPNRLPDHTIEIDQDHAAQQAIDFLLAGGVGTGQLLEDVRLVGGVVIDVQVGAAVEPLDQEVDELLEGALLGIGVVPPEVVVERGATDHHQDAEQVLQAAVAHERVALDVEEQVGGGGGREG